jgi:hypothetical protein
MGPPATGALSVSRLCVRITAYTETNQRHAI